MASTVWSVRKEVQELASRAKIDLPKDIQDALKTGDNPAPILTWLSQNRKDLAERFVKNKFTNAILTFSNETKIEIENVFQKMQVFCCNAFLGTGNVVLKAKKRELIDLFNKLDPTFQKEISANKNRDKLFPPLDEMKIFVGALDKVADSDAISEACREFLERMRLLPSRDTIGVEARKVRVVALEPNKHNTESDCAKAEMLAGKAEIISSAEPIQKVVIKELMSRIASSWSHENVSLMLGNLEKVLNFPECNSLREFQKLCQENAIRFEISESLILNLSNAPNLSFDELLSYLETNPLHQFAVREIKRLLSARAHVDKDAAMGRQDILSSGSIDYAPTPHSINSQPGDWGKINSTRDEDIFLTPSRLDPGLNLGKEEDKTLSPSLHSDKKDDVGLWKQMNFSRFTGEGEGLTAVDGEIEGTPSIFPGIDDADDEFTYLLANSKLKKETPSVDDEEAHSDPNNPSKPLLSPKPATHELAKKQLETTKKISGEKEEGAALGFPKENDTRDKKQEKKERKEQEESKKKAWPFRSPEKKITHLPEDMISPSKDRFKELESALGDKKEEKEEKEDGDRVKENISRKKTQSGHMPQAIKRGNREGFGKVISPDEEESLVTKEGVVEDHGDPHRIAPAVIAPRAPLLPGDSTRHIIQGLSPFYRELRGVYYHLKDDPEGYKHISIPMLHQYIEKLKEIKASKDLKIKGRDLWETLNPTDTDFQAEQLLKENILEKALAQHKDQYLPEFEDKLSVDGGIYEPQSKCYYFEKKEGIIYLMLKKGAKPSRIELQEAYREYNVICQDMFNKTNAEIYICDSEFNRDPKNQKEVAAIITRLEVKLAEDDQVQGSNKAVHEAVHKISIKMKDPEPATASKLVDENSLTAETLLSYRVVLENNRSTFLETKESDGLEREQYLDMVYEWEKDSNWASYLQGVGTVSRLLPDVTKESYRKQKVLIHLNPLELAPEQLKKVERESTKRDTERRQHYESEKRIEATISARAEDTDWLEKDIAAAKTEALELSRIYGDCDESATDSDLELALKASLETYEKERRKRLGQDYKYDIHNVLGDGNRFYYAAADQMKQQGISRFNQPNVDLHASLRHLVQGGTYSNGEWAGVQQLFTLVKKAKVIIAVMDTRHPNLGFRCYYRDRQGNLAETYDSDELKRQAADQTIIHLAYTGAYYMSVRGYRDLQVGARQGSFNIAERQRQSRSVRAEYSEQNQRRSNVASERQSQSVRAEHLEQNQRRSNVASERQSQSVRAQHSEQNQSRANVLSEKENTKPNLWGQHTVRLEQAFDTAVGTKKPRTLFEHKSEHSHPFNFFPDPVEEVADLIEETAESVEQHKSSSVTLRLRSEEE